MIDNNIFTLSRLSNTIEGEIVTNLMTQLIVILGPNGVGKSTTAMKIKDQYSGSAFVDSDWCRVMNPFPLTDITTETVIKNMYCLLRNYLLCEEINTIIFTYSWHGGRKELYDKVITLLRNDGIEFKENIIILKCSEPENRKRALADNRDIERVERGMQNTFSFYDELEYPCINTTNMTVSEAAERVWSEVYSNCNDPNC